MSARPALVVLVLASLVGPWAGAATAGTGTVGTGTLGNETVGAGTVETGSAGDPSFVALYPNPVADGDAGEYVVVRFPRPTDLSGWAIDDGETRAALPNRTVRGRVAFATDPALARAEANGTVIGLAGSLSLANGGETLRLVEGNRTVDRATYRDAPESERRVDRGGEWTWEPLGATDWPAFREGDGRVRAFVLPDDPEVVIETLRSADERVLLGGYSFTSARVAAELRRAAERGVRVRVLVDGSPVGGLSRREGRLLGSLSDAGVEVRVLDGPHARYDYHHAKYAVVDDRALVLSENWKAAGVGGRSSRGWGVVVRDPAVADDVAAIFRADAGWRDSVRWERFRRNETFAAGTRANGTYPRRFAPRTVPVDSVRVLVAPDNAEAELLALLRGANESVRVQQMAVGGRTQPFLREAVAAARRGVRVRILLSGAWYVEEENRRIAEWLNRRADAEGLPLAARLARPRGRYEKIHNKGVIVDGDRAVVGSVNWNNHSARENRELAVVLSGEAAGAYYARVFDADWRASAWRLAIGYALAVLTGVGAAAGIGRRRIAFE